VNSEEEAVFASHTVPKPARARLSRKLGLISLRHGTEPAVSVRVQFLRRPREGYFLIVENGSMSATAVFLKLNVLCEK